MVPGKAGSVRWALLLAALVVLRPAGPAAHDDPGDRITELSHRIARNPDDTALLLQRGRLLRLGGHHEAALRDFRQVARRGDGPGEVDFQLGLTLRQANRPAEARPHLDRYLAAFPDDLQARTARARVLVTLGDNLAAADDFTRVIAVAPLPEHYTERARALAVAGHLDEALRGLDEAQERLGLLVALQRLAIDLELARDDVEGALLRVGSMAEITGRDDIWLARRGDILRQAGRHGEARAAYGQALAAIEALPRRRQRSKSVRDLKTRLEAALRQGAATERSTASRPGEGEARDLQ